MVLRCPRKRVVEVRVVPIGASLSCPAIPNSVEVPSTLSMKTSVRISEASKASLAPATKISA